MAAMGLDGGGAGFGGALGIGPAAAEGAGETGGSEGDGGTWIDSDAGGGGFRKSGERRVAASPAAAAATDSSFFADPPSLFAGASPVDQLSGVQQRPRFYMFVHSNQSEIAFCRPPGINH